jgi:DNA-binding transcriptional MerR regulator
MMSSDETRPFAPTPSNDLSESHPTPRPVAKVLSIDHVAETFGISRWLLRFCELRGLIKRRSRIGNIRVYSWAECDRIAFIIKCRRAGLRFSEIAPILHATDSDSARVHEAGQELCMALVQKLEAHRKMVDEALSELGHVHALLGDELRGDTRRWLANASDV